MKYCIGILLLLTLMARADEPELDCKAIAQKFESLVDKVYTPNTGLLKDAERGTTFSYEDKMEKAFHATKKADLEALFTGPNRIKYKDIEQLYDLIKAGVIKTTPDKEKFIDEFYMFLQDKQEILNGDKDQVYNLLKGMQNRDAASGYSAARTDAAVSTDAGMNAVEKNLLDQAIAETKGVKNPTTKFYDGILNFFSPHNKRMQQILNLNNQLRKKMQAAYASVEPADDALTKYAATLSPAEASKIKSVIGTAGTDTAEARKIIEDVYGKQLTETDPIKVGEQRLRLLAKKVEAQKAPSNGSIAANAERNLDNLDEALAESRKRKNQVSRPMSEYHPAQLEIRHGQYVRETGEMASRYSDRLSKTAPRSEYRVKAEWTVDVHCSEPVQVTKTRTVDVPDGEDSNGNTIYRQEEQEYQDTEIRTWTENYQTQDTFTLDASYDEVLWGTIEPDVGRVSSNLPSRGTNGIAHADNATNDKSSVRITWVDSERTSDIISRARKARETEKPLRITIDESIQTVGKIRDEYQAIRATEEGRKKAVSTLNKVKENLQAKVDSILKNYAKLADDEIKKLWPDEVVQEFRQRNELQLARYLHMIKRIDHFGEQVTRNVDHLELEFVLSDHSEKMAFLDAHAARNKKIIIGTTTGAAVAGAAYGGYKYLEANQPGMNLGGSSDQYKPYVPDYSPEQVAASQERLERMAAVTKEYTDRYKENLAADQKAALEEAEATERAEQAARAKAKIKAKVKEKAKTQEVTPESAEPASAPASAPAKKKKKKKVVEQEVKKEVINE